jgi:hypothetical protein
LASDFLVHRILNGHNPSVLELMIWACHRLLRSGVALGFDGFLGALFHLMGSYDAGEVAGVVFIFVPIRGLLFGAPPSGIYPAFVVVMNRRLQAVEKSVAESVRRVCAALPEGEDVVGEGRSAGGFDMFDRETSPVVDVKEFAVVDLDGCRA